MGRSESATFTCLHLPRPPCARGVVCIVLCGRLPNTREKEEHTPCALCTPSTPLTHTHAQTHTHTQTKHTFYTISLPLSVPPSTSLLLPIHMPPSSRSAPPGLLLVPILVQRDLVLLHHPHGRSGGTRREGKKQPIHTFIMTFKQPINNLLTPYAPSPCTRVGKTNYEELCKHAFGWTGYMMVSICMFLYDFGAYVK